MIKRPILWAAIALAVAVMLSIQFFPEHMMPVPAFADREEILLYGTVDTIQMQKERVHLFLSAASACSREQESETLRKLPGKTLLILDAADPIISCLAIGNRISASGTFQFFSKARNQGNFDENLFYYSSGVFSKVESGSGTCQIISARVRPIRQFLFQLRKEMTSSIEEAIAEEETACILAAICTGDRSLLTAQSKALYQNSGIAHILAISGLHISLLGMTVFRVLRRRLRFCLAAGISGTLMLGFCIMSSASSSAVRATIMFLIQMGSIGLGKSYDMTCSLSVAGILLLLFHPLLILNTGFQLSFAAVLGAAFLYPALDGLFQNPSLHMLLQRRKKNGLYQRFLSGFFMSLSVTLATLPVTAASFYEIPLYAVLLNILVVPLMSLVLGSGMACACLGMISVFLGRFFAASGVYLVRMIQWICKLTGTFPGSRVVVGCPAPWKIVLYYGLLILGVKLADRYRWEQIFRSRKAKRRKIHRRKRMLFAATVSWLTVSIAVLFLRMRPRLLRISMLDVGQGECILLQSPSGAVYMIDGGSTSVNQVARYRICSALHYLGIDQVDDWIITHPDRDHISGILEILEAETLQAPDSFEMEIGRLLTPVIPDNENDEQLISLAVDAGIPVTDLRKGMRIEDGVLTMSCLHPAASFSGDDSNAFSAVMDIRYGDFAMIATGDLRQEEEAILLKDPEISWPCGGYQVLKTAHHGSAGSSSSDFLKKVSPRAAIISAGIRNRYGHPAEETLDRLREVGAMIFCTSETGEIILEADICGTLKVSTMWGS